MEESLGGNYGGTGQGLIIVFGGLLMGLGLIELFLSYEAGTLFNNKWKGTWRYKGILISILFTCLTRIRGEGPADDSDINNALQTEIDKVGGKENITKIL